MERCSDPNCEQCKAARAKLADSMAHATAADRRKLKMAAKGTVVRLSNGQMVGPQVRRVDTRQARVIPSDLSPARLLDAPTDLDRQRLQRADERRQRRAARGTN